MRGTGNREKITFNDFTPDCRDADWRVPVYACSQSDDAGSEHSNTATTNF